MSDGTSGIPPSGSQPPKPDDLSPKPMDIKPSNSPEDLTSADEGQNEYLGMIFSSPQDLAEFKGKFLSNMINMFIWQIKTETDHMVNTLKKMRDEDGS